MKRYVMGAAWAAAGVAICVSLTVGSYSLGNSPPGRQSQSSGSAASVDATPSGTTGIGAPGGSSDSRRRLGLPPVPQDTPSEVR